MPDVAPVTRACCPSRLFCSLIANAAPWFVISKSSAKSVGGASHAQVISFAERLGHRATGRLGVRRSSRLGRIYVFPDAPGRVRSDGDYDGMHLWCCDQG